MGFRERGGRMSLRRAPVTSVSWGLEKGGQDEPEESSRHLRLWAGNCRQFLGRKQSTLVVIVAPGLELGEE